MIKYIRLIIAVVIISTLGSCYKDLGNYKYHPINEVEIIADTNSYTVSQQQVLKISVDLSESIPQSGSYSYEWVMYEDKQAPLTRRILDTTKDLDAIITEAPGSYVLDYFVKDNKTDVNFRKKFHVQVVSAFGQGWLMIEENGGSSDLSLIADKDHIFKNIYSGTNGYKLPAGAEKITITDHYRFGQQIYILSPNDLLEVSYIDFIKVNNYSDFFYNPPIPKPDLYYMNGTNVRFINGGKVYGYSTMVPPPFAFGLAIDGPGGYYAMPFQISSVYGDFFYDSTSKAFYRMGSYDTELGGFPNYNPATDAFDMNNVGKKMIYADHYTQYLHNALFKNLDDDSLFIYTINAANSGFANAKYDVTQATDLLQADHYKMSQTLNYLYYAAGNKIYKLDIFAQTSTLLTTLPAGTSVADMELYYNASNSSDPDNNQVLAVAANNGNNGTVYMFRLAATGNFENDTYFEKYDGFGKLVCLTYKNAK